MRNNRAWIQYTKQGRIVPGSLIISKTRPVNGVWYEVVEKIYYDSNPPYGVINSRQKAFVKYDGSGRIVPGSLIITNNTLPKPGIWKEVYINKCCDTSSLPFNCIEFVVNTTVTTYFEFNFTTLGAINFTIDWGDGTTHPDSGIGGFYEENHTYPQADTEYTVRVCFDSISSVIQLNFPGDD